MSEIKDVNEEAFKEHITKTDYFISLVKRYFDYKSGPDSLDEAIELLEEKLDIAEPVCLDCIDKVTLLNRLRKLDKNGAFLSMETPEDHAEMSDIMREAYKLSVTRRIRNE